MLDAHNYYRSLHDAQPLKHNATVEQSAQKWADKLLATKKLEKDGNSAYGQNVGHECRDKHGEMPIIDGLVGTSLWYDEIQKYSFPNPGPQKGTDHFEQVVWADTKQLGVGVASDGINTYWVAHYEPPGRKGDYAKNVQKPNSLNSF